MAKATTKKAKALAERGTFKPQENTEYPDPYSVLTYAAVRPYVSRSAASVAVWGDTLPSLVPPCVTKSCGMNSTPTCETMFTKKHSAWLLHFARRWT
mgnify:CR=1 FL=1